MKLKRADIRKDKINEYYQNICMNKNEPITL